MDYLCLTLVGRHGEAEPAFKTRLSEFWTSVVRGEPDLFERVYAERTAFESFDGTPGRTYLVEADAAETVAALVTRSGLSHRPLDADDVYTKYEAAPPDWFWIEH